MFPGMQVRGRMIPYRSSTVVACMAAVECNIKAGIWPSLLKSLIENERRLYPHRAACRVENS
jgi:hypothetical protein